MECKPVDTHLTLGSAGEQAARGREVDAELVLGRARGDLGMGARIDVRIDAQRDMGPLAQASRDAVERVQLGVGFDVDLPDATAQRIGQLLVRLADAREDDAGGGNVRGQRALQLTARDHVGTRALARQHAQNGLVGVGLEGVTDRGWQVRERIGIGAVGAPQGCGRIDVERRADLAREFLERHALGLERAVADGELSHSDTFSGIHLPCRAAIRAGPCGRTPRRTWPRRMPEGARSAGAS